MTLRTDFRLKIYSMKDTYVNRTMDFKCKYHISSKRHELRIFYFWNWSKVNKERKTMAKFIFILTLTFLMWQMALSQSRIRIDDDGGYRGIVVRIGNQVPEEDCKQILQNIKVRQQWHILIVKMLWCECERD